MMDRILLFIGMTLVIVPGRIFMMKQKFYSGASERRAERTEQWQTGVLAEGEHG